MVAVTIIASKSKKALSILLYYLFNNLGHALGSVNCFFDLAVNLLPFNRVHWVATLVKQTGKSLLPEFVALVFEIVNSNILLLGTPHFPQVGHQSIQAGSCIQHQRCHFNGIGGSILNFAKYHGRTRAL